MGDSLEGHGWATAVYEILHKVSDDRYCAYVHLDLSSSRRWISSWLYCTCIPCLYKCWKLFSHKLFSRMPCVILANQANFAFANNYFWKNCSIFINSDGQSITVLTHKCTQTVGGLHLPFREKSSFCHPNVC